MLLLLFGITIWVLHADIQLVSGQNVQPCNPGDKDKLVGVIVYKCVNVLGVNLYEPDACFVQSLNTTIKAGNSIKDQLFQYTCSQDGQSVGSTMTLSTTCIDQNGNAVNFGQPFQTLNGVVTCNKDSVTGQVTRGVTPGCLDQANTVRKTGDKWVFGSTQYVCNFQNGQFHTAACGCVSTSGAITAVGAHTSTPNGYQKCVQDAQDQSKASFQAIQSVCVNGTETHSLDSKWNIGSTAYECIENNSMAVIVPYACYDSASNTTVTFGAYGKYGSRYFSCSRSTHTLTEITSPFCNGTSGVHNLTTDWVEGNQTFHCYYNSGTNSCYASVTGCAYNSGSVAKNATVQSPDKTYAVSCVLGSNGDYSLHRLSDAEYTAWKVANGLGDGSSQTVDGGSGQGGQLTTTPVPQEKTTQPPPPPPPNTTKPPPPPPPPNTTQPPPPPPPNTTQPPPPPPPNTTKPPPPPPPTTTHSPPPPPPPNTTQPPPPPPPNTTKPPPPPPPTTTHPPPPPPPSTTHPPPPPSSKTTQPPPPPPPNTTKPSPPPPPSTTHPPPPPPPTTTHPPPPPPPTTTHKAPPTEITTTKAHVVTTTHPHPPSCEDLSSICLSLASVCHEDNNHKGDKSSESEDRSDSSCNSEEHVHEKPQHHGEHESGDRSGKDNKPKPKSPEKPKPKSPEKPNHGKSPKENKSPDKSSHKEKGHEKQGKGRKRRHAPMEKLEPASYASNNKSNSDSKGSGSSSSSSSEESDVKMILDGQEVDNGSSSGSSDDKKESTSIHGNGSNGPKNRNKRNAAGHDNKSDSSSSSESGSGSNGESSSNSDESDSDKRKDENNKKLSAHKDGGDKRKGRSAANEPSDDSSSNSDSDSDDQSSSDSGDSDVNERKRRSANKDPSDSSSSNSDNDSTDQSSSDSDGSDDDETTEPKRRKKRHFGLGNWGTGFRPWPKANSSGDDKSRGNHGHESSGHRNEKDCIDVKAKYLKVVRALCPRTCNVCGSRTK